MVLLKVDTFYIKDLNTSLNIDTNTVQTMNTTNNNI